MDDTRAGSPAAAPPVPCCDSARGVGAGAAQRPCRPRAAPAGTGATRTESPPRSCWLSAPQLQPVYSPADGADVQVRAVGARREPPWGSVRATSSAPDAVSAGPMSAPRGAAAETLPTRVPSKTSASCSADQDRGADLRGIERGERNSVQVDRAAVGIGAAGRQAAQQGGRVGWVGGGHAYDVAWCDVEVEILEGAVRDAAQADSAIDGLRQSSAAREHGSVRGEHVGDPGRGRAPLTR